MAADVDPGRRGGEVAAIANRARRLHPAGRDGAPARLDTVGLVEIAEGLAAAHRDVVPLGQQLLLQTDCYEAWLMAIPSGGRLSPRSQGGPVAVHVTAGDVTAIWPSRVRRLGPGAGEVDDHGRAPLLVNPGGRIAVAVVVVGSALRQSEGEGPCWTVLP